MPFRLASGWSEPVHDRPRLRRSVYCVSLGVGERFSAHFRFRSRGSPSAEERRAAPSPGPLSLSTAQVARLVARLLQALGPAEPMAFTRNQYSVPLVRPVTVHFDALPT